MLIETGVPVTDFTEFQALQQRVGATCTLEACCRDDSTTRLCPKYCSPKNSFFNTDLRGHTLWLHPPAARADEFVRYYSDFKTKNPLTIAAIMLLPQGVGQKWHTVLPHMKLVKEYQTSTRTPSSAMRAAVEAPLQVWWDPPVQNQPQKCALAGGSSMIFRASVQGVQCKTLIDTGASHVYVSVSLARQLGLRVHPAQDAKGIEVIGVGDTALRGLGTCSFKIRIAHLVSRVTNATVLEELIPGVDVILGDEWLREYKADLSYEHMHVKVAGHVLVPMARMDQDLTPQGLIDYCMAVLAKAAEPPPVLSARQAARLLRRGARHFLVHIESLPASDQAGGSDPPAPTTSPDLQAVSNQPGPSVVAAAVSNQSQSAESGHGLMSPEAIGRIMAEFSDVLVDTLPPGLPPDRGVPHTIPLAPGAAPTFRPMYRMSPAETRELQKQVTDLLAKGHIQPSTSPFAAPVLFVEKADGSLRMVIDYRALNRITVKNRYPLPRIDELIDRMQGCTVFSKLDLASGYNQIRITQEDIKKTAFRTPFGHFEYRVLPQGLANAPATFQAFMNSILGPLRDHVLVYLDDICVISKNPEEHERHLRQLLQLLRENKLYAKASKCEFNRTDLRFLGHVVGRDGLRVDPDKIKTVREWPVPKDVQQVRQFLGLCNYFRKYIMGYAAIAAPMQDLVNKKAPWVWGDKQQQAFEALKHALTHAPVLVLPDFTKPFEVISDASLLGTGAVLMQGGRPVAFTSKKLTPAEHNYSTTDQELLGVVRAMSEWRCYLEGSDVTLVTDHNPLVYLDTQPSLSRRQARWMEFLSRFKPNTRWEYRAGRTNLADPISRNPALGRDPQVVAAVTKTRPEATLLDRIRAAYATDAWLQEPENKKLLTREQGLYQVANTIYVPAGDLRTDIIRAHHCPPYAGHVGTSKTVKAVQRTFFWPGMRKEIRFFVQTCDACQRNKADNQLPGGLLQPLEIPERKWAHVTMDAITQLPKTERGADAILVMVDKLTKMCHFAPTTSDFTAEMAAEIFVNHVIKAHGLPIKIITDRGQNFTGRFWQELCKLWVVEKATSTAFHPQTDGQTERANRTLEDMLRHYVCADHTDWDRHLAAAEFAVNNAWHETIQNTPFFLNYGQHPLTPVTMQTDDKVPAARATAQQLAQYIQKARKCLQAAQERQKAYADQSRRHVEYKVGQEVLVSSKNFTFKADGSRKFMPKYIGPFPIQKLVGPVAVQLLLPSNLRLHPVFHVSLIRPYHRSQTTHVAPPPLMLDSEGLPEFAVDKIVGHRQTNHNRKKVWQFLVQWQGYGPEHNSWEMQWDVGSPLIAEYWSRIGGEPDLGNRIEKVAKKKPDKPPGIKIATRRCSARVRTRIDTGTEVTASESRRERTVDPPRHTPTVPPKIAPKHSRVQKRRGQR